MTERESVPVLGWRERIDFPEWGLSRIRAKVDTGARTSAIDVTNVEELPDGLLRFEVVSRTSPSIRTKTVTAPLARKSTVKPSSGKAQERYVCVTPIRIGEHEFEIEVSLVRRQGMLCRMLLGRMAIAGRFLVDPSKKYIQTPGRKK